MINLATAMQRLLKASEEIAAKDAEILKLKERLEQAEQFIPKNFRAWCSNCKHYTEDNGQQPWVICEHCGENRSEG